MNKLVLILTLIYLNKHVSAKKIECGYKQCPQTREGALNVHLIAHSHMDAGWVKTYDQYYYGSKPTISTANVQLIFHSVLSELLHDKRRKFTFSEVSYFWRWWKEQRPATRTTFRGLVQEGRVEFAGGGWVQGDEATTDYLMILDQFTWGLRKMNDTLGPCGKPKAAWQIDTYGHTREHASLLAQMGYDGLFIGRVNHKDRESMLEEERMEFMWRGSDVLGKMSDIMTHTLYNLYNAPDGFCFDFLCNEEPIIDDPDSKAYNAEKRVNDFITQIEHQAKYYEHDNIMVTMGGDFTYQSAANWFMSMDKLINHVNTHPANMSDINIFYSSPSCYLKALYLNGRRDKAIYTEKGDHLPYGSDSSTYWTGFYTSRPSIKYLTRKTHIFLQIAKQLTVLARMGDSYELHLLRHALGLMMHHDAITGTSQQHVANDFVKMLSEAFVACAKKVSTLLSYLTPTWAGTRRSKSNQQFNTCYQINMSQCPFVEGQESLLLLVYNPQSVKTYHYVRLPAIALHYVVRNAYDEELEYQLSPLAPAVTNLPGRTATTNHELVFEAENVPPLGFASFYVTAIKDPLGDLDYMKNKKLGPDPELFTQISNEYLKVTINKQTGLLESIQHVSGAKVQVSQNFYYYGQTRGSLQSGAYSFRPDQRPTPIAEKATYNTIRGALVKEIHQRFSSWASQTLRLYRGEEYLELDWVIGPVPISWASQTLRLYRGEEYLELDWVIGPVPISWASQTLRLYRGEEYLELDWVIGPVPIRTSAHQVLRLEQDGTLVTHQRFSSWASQTLRLYRGEEYLELDWVIGPVPIRTSAHQVLRLEQDGTLVTHQRFSSWASKTLRLYRGEEYLELDWVIGPVPISTDLGKEVVSIFTSNISNRGEFYTDSNTRQMMKRSCRNESAGQVVKKPVASCYYPVTSRLCIQAFNDSTGMCILTDRTQGGTSYDDGDIELMVHRRLLTDDGFGLDETLNEEEHGSGLVVRGQHRLFLGKHKQDGEELPFQERASYVARHWLWEPWVFAAAADKLNRRKWQSMRNKRRKNSRSKSEPCGSWLWEPWVFAAAADKLNRRKWQSMRNKRRKNSRSKSEPCGSWLWEPWAFAAAADKLNRRKWQSMRNKRRKNSRSKSEPCGSWLWEPWVFAAAADKLNRRKWQSMRNKRFSALRVHGLPRHVRILTLEPWKAGSVLLRLENTLEKNDRTTQRLELPDDTPLPTHINVELRKLFQHLKIKSVRETTLAANQWLEEARQMDWSTRYVYTGGEDGILSEDVDYVEDEKSVHKDSEAEPEQDSDYSAKRNERRNKHKRTTRYENRRKRAINISENFVDNDFTAGSEAKEITTEADEQIDESDFNDSIFFINVTGVDEETKELTAEVNFEEIDVSINKTDDSKYFVFGDNSGLATEKTVKRRKFSSELKTSDSFEDVSSIRSSRKDGLKRPAEHIDINPDETDDGVTKSMYEMYYKKKTIVKLKKNFKKAVKSRPRWQKRSKKISEDKESTVHKDDEMKPIAPYGSRAYMYESGEEKQSGDEVEDVNMEPARMRTRRQREAGRRKRATGRTALPREDPEFVITLRPTQIRTFIIRFESSKTNYVI
ncbi:lysosomal alpha-mannosidase-like [Cydia strobilella]|uniref:lysosomal alpha-mannosidase-like n=1 Tax=Cydia strobilella TaxID=1100964 RepID=UPI0030066766